MPAAPCRPNWRRWKRASANPARPVVAIVGGAKVSTKIDLLMNLVKKVDALVIGGGMANTFIAARGTNVGKSLCEHDLAETAKQIMIEAATAGCAIVLPEDGVIAREFKAGAANETVDIERHSRPMPWCSMSARNPSRPSTPGSSGRNPGLERPARRLRDRTLRYRNGRCCEIRRWAHQVAGKLTSVAGGGDTVSALNHAGVADDFTYVSTAGGAFLEWMEGKELPGVAILNAARSNRQA